MKPLIQKTAGLLCALLIMANIIYAQAPNMFNYQAVARNAAGTVLSNQSIGIQFTILDGSSTGTTVYQETQTVTTNSLGLFTAAIGGGTIVSGTMSSVNWALGEKFVTVQIDPTGGTSYTVTGTSQLLSVPYALYAANGGGSGGGGQWATSGSNISNTNSGDVGIGTASPAYRLDVAGNFHIAAAAVAAGFSPGNDAVFENTGASGTEAALELLNTNNSSYVQLIGTTTSQLMLWNNTGYANLNCGALYGNGASSIVSTTNGAALYLGSPNPGTGPNNNNLIVGNTNAATEAAITLQNSNSSGVSLVASTSDILYVAANSGGAADINCAALQGNAPSYIIAPQKGAALYLSSPNPGSGPNANNLIIVNDSASTDVAISMMNKNSSGVQLIATAASALNVIPASGTGYATVNAGTYNNLSDITMKKDIQYLKNNDFNTCLDQIRNIQSIRFRYNYESETEKQGLLYRPNLHLGVSAQSLPVEVASAMVDPASHDKKLGMSLGDMSGLLVAGVKALDNQQVEMTKVIADQQKAIEELKKEIEALKNK